eukprot:3674482-Pyramimonas_sp.AAC.1
MAEGGYTLSSAASTPAATWLSLALVFHSRTYSRHCFSRSGSMPATALTNSRRKRHGFRRHSQ